MIKPHHTLFPLVTVLVSSVCLLGTDSSQGAQTRPARSPSDSTSITFDKPVTFRSMTLPNPVETGPDAQASRAVLREFRRRYPNIHIKRFSMPTIEGMGMDTGPLMAIAAGVPPHAIYVNFRQSSTYINHGFLKPLEILLARLKSDNPRVRQTDGQGHWREEPKPAEIEHWRKRILARMPEVARKVVYRRPWNEQVGDEKHVWAIPTQLVAHVLLYRKDHFRAAGLDPNDPPSNWKQLRQYARKLTIDGRKGLMVAKTAYGIYDLLGPAGVDAMRRNDQNEWEATFATENAAKAIFYIWKMVKEDQSVHLAVGSDWAWDSGGVSMQFDTLAEDLYSDLNPQQVGVAPIPDAPVGKDRGGLVNAAMVGVFAESSPRQQLAVMKYIWFITSPEAQRIKTKKYVESGYGRFVNPNLLKKFGYTEMLNRVPKGWREAFAAAATNGTPEPYGRNTQFIYDRMDEPIHRAFTQPLGGLPDKQAKKQILQWLKQAQYQVNTKSLNRLSDQQKLNRRVVGGCVLMLVVSLLSICMAWVWRAFKREEIQGLGDRPLRRFVFGYILLAPVIGLLVFWDYGPLTGGAIISFYDFELVLPSQFIGIDNFANAVFDAQFWAAFGRTFYFAALVVGLGFWPPILLALLLDEVPTETAKYTFRTIFYLPQIISGVIVVFLWKQFYAQDGGALNQLLQALNGLGPVMATLLKWVVLGLWLSFVGLLLWLPYKMKELSWPIRGAVTAAGLALVGVTVYPLVAAYIGPSAIALEALRQQGENPATHMGLAALGSRLGQMFGPFHVESIDWLNSPEVAMLCCVIPMIWSTTGPACIIYLAALKTVPRDMYEAAALDGAGFWQKVCYITLPRIKLLIVIQFIVAVIGAFKGGTDFILAMTGGGPVNATRILSLEIFERTFMGLSFGLGAAMAWILGVVLIGFTAYQLRRLSRTEFTADNA